MRVTLRKAFALPQEGNKSSFKFNSTSANRKLERQIDKDEGKLKLAWLKQ